MVHNGVPLRLGVENAASPAPASLWGAALFAAALCLTAARLAWLAAQPVGLYPDEAQYWVWAQHLALGYYSKPPLVAWIIALTTRLAGDGEFGVRLAAPLLHAVAAGFVYGIGARLYGARTGFWSGLAYLTLPGVSVSSVIMSTDAALLPCWAAALYAFVRAREDGGAGWWIAAGLACGFGLLAKYAMAYWLLSAFLWVAVVRGERRHLPGLGGAAALAVLVWLPNLLWNQRYGFVSLLHLRDNAHLQGGLFHPGALGQFFFAQFGVFGPLLLAGLLWALADRRTLAEPRARLLAAFALPTMGLMLLLALLSRAHANWAAPAYVSATVLAIAAPAARGRGRLAVAAVAVNALVAVVLFGAPPALNAAGIAVPAKYDPLHRLRGWRTLGAQVGASLAAHPGLQLLADDRETLAALLFYVRPHPLDAAEWRLRDRATDQWELTNGLSRYRGHSFLLVSAHNLIAEMRPSFAAIEPLQPLAIPIGPGAERRYTLYIARDFKGYDRDRR